MAGLSVEDLTRLEAALSTLNSLARHQNLTFGDSNGVLLTLHGDDGQNNQVVVVQAEGTSCYELVLA